MPTQQAVAVSSTEQSLPTRKRDGHVAGLNDWDAQQLAGKRPKLADESPSIASPTQARNQVDTSEGIGLDALKRLLDFSSLSSHAEITKQFDELAAALLHEYRLVISNHGKETTYRIIEMEFYLRSDCHQDPFTHGSEEQRASGKWYFHRAPQRSLDSTRSLTSSTSYRGGSRKGMDLTIAGPVDSVDLQPQALRGGILLRSLRRLSDNKVISGPSLLVDEVLRVSGVSEIRELVMNKWKSDTSAFLDPLSSFDKDVRLFLSRDPAGSSSSVCVTSSRPRIYTSPRIGLDLSHPGTTPTPTHPRVIFLSKPYRYFTHPELLTANGRCQTFLGALSHIRLCDGGGKLPSQMKLKSEISRITGMKEPTAAKYLAYYEEGLAKGSLARFVGAAGKGAAASPESYLKMMGTLERIQAAS